MSDINDKAHQLLVDAMMMLRDIEKARQLPAFAQVYQQYVALGREIEAYLTSRTGYDDHEGD